MSTEPTKQDSMSEPAIVRAVHRVIDCRSSVGETMGMIDAAIHCAYGLPAGVMFKACSHRCPRASTTTGSLTSVEVPRLPTDREINAVNDVADEYGVSRDVMHIALAKVHRLIAARVRADIQAERNGEDGRR